MASNCMLRMQEAVGLCYEVLAGQEIAVLCGQQELAKHLWATVDGVNNSRTIQQLACRGCGTGSCTCGFSTAEQRQHPSACMWLPLYTALFGAALAAVLSQSCSGARLLQQHQCLDGCMCVRPGPHMCVCVCRRLCLLPCLLDCCSFWHTTVAAGQIRG
jgi:hypothetical protein